MASEFGEVDDQRKSYALLEGLKSVFGEDQITEPVMEYYMSLDPAEVDRRLQMLDGLKAKWQDSATLPVQRSGMMDSWLNVEKVEKRKD